MSDSDTTTTNPTTPPPDQDSTAMEPKPQNDTVKDLNKLTSISLRIWPPTQRTRDAVIARLIENLSEPSVLSKRYGTIPQEEAAATAHIIEEEAFVAAGAAASTEDDGIEILQVYSKEISKRMLETIKAKANATANSSASNAAAASVDDGASAGAGPEAVTPTEDVSSIENEA
ncbi:WPP domain-containing protein [Cephalotus follicularis]|uniref:WPP domain-containing protein n=1 Tax=Cephalotus follicularis TaxID=3775 RepID=A0A1Q3C373_CEPFO|nr:WPP domain-containing protein [Cephalotus follicularis]